MRRFGLTLAVLVGAVLTASLLAQVPTNVLNPASDLAGKTLVTAEGARTISGVFTWTVPMRTLAGTTGSPGVTGSTDTTTGLTLGTALVGVSISGVQQLLVSPSGVSSATGFTGTILTAAQPNITSTGALTAPSLTTPGDISWNNNTGFGLKGSDGVRFLSYTNSTGAVIGAGANPTLISSFGNNAASGSGTGVNRFGVVNASAGAGNAAQLYVQNNNAYTGGLELFAGNYSTGTYDVANGLALYADANVVGLNIAALGASAPIDFYTFGATRRMRIMQGVNVGGSGDPGATNLAVAGTLAIGGITTLTGGIAGPALLIDGDIADVTAAPTKSSGCGGAGLSITGKDYAFLVVMGAVPGASCVLNFNLTYTHAPICIAQNTNDAPTGTNVSATSTQITLTSGGYSAGDIIDVLCRGW